MSAQTSEQLVWLHGRVKELQAGAVELRNRVAIPVGLADELDAVRANLGRGLTVVSNAVGEAVVREASGR